MPFPKLTFVSRELPAPSTECVVDGIDKIAEKIEKNNYSNICVITSKKKKMFAKSVYVISDMSKAFEICPFAVLLHLADMTATYLMEERIG